MMNYGMNIAIRKILEKIISLITRVRHNQIGNEYGKSNQDEWNHIRGTPTRNRCD